MIDLYITSFHWHLLIGLFIGANIALVILSLTTLTSKKMLEDELTLKNNSIDNLRNKNILLQKENIELKGNITSTEFEAKCLIKMKDDLQIEFDELKQYYNQLESDYKEVFADYKKLFIELDSIKAAEVRKFRDPQEIINQMVNERTKNILLEVA